MEELGIPHSWKVIQLDESSNLFAAHLVDLLQGIEHGDIPQADQRMFLERLSDVRETLQAAQNQADLYFVRDFQLAPLATLFPWIRPSLWMCHVDTANPDPGERHISINSLVLITSVFLTRHYANDRHFQRKKQLHFGS
jgi:trehalose synthase